MHLEILVEDLSGRVALETLIPRLISVDDSFRVHSYRGIGHIPKDLRNAKDPSKRILLANLPGLLRGYGKTFEGYPHGQKPFVIVVCDLDDKPIESFLNELRRVLDACNPAPNTRFCLAIEEGEAWLLGDIPAICRAYPNARRGVLEAYENDSICGTWEVLADAVYVGGEKALSSRGPMAIGTEKSRWAANIAPYMDVEHNNSPSFTYFRSTIRQLVE